MVTENFFSRRQLLQKAVGAAALGSALKLTENEANAQRPRGGTTYGPINKYSAPSQLRITDMRAVVIASGFDFPIIRIDTNQGVYGYGEVRDFAPKGVALGLKPLLVGRNPLDITAILDSIRSYAGHGRQGGGYSAVDMALHDLVGKVFGVPVWRLLGDKKTSRIRIYADTQGTTDPKKYGERMKQRKDMGFTYFKMDVNTHWIGGRDKPGILDQFGIPTDKGLDAGCELIAAVKDAIGWDAPLAVDVAGLGVTRSIKDAIRVSRAFEKYQLAFLEDLFGTGTGFKNWQGYKEVRAATTSKLATGEDTFGLKEGFKDLIDNRAIDVIHPDMQTSGGCLETKRICDYAHEQGITAVFHMGSSPVAAIAGAHVACTLRNFASMECHSIDYLSWWQQLITGVPQPIIEKGFMTVPDKPGLGIELNEPVVREHLREGGYFEPTPEYDKVRFLGPATSGPWPHFNVDGKWVNERTSDY